MRKHHTKSKGDLGVLKAQVTLFEQGYLSLLPQTEHSEFDLVAYKEGIFKRVQVKYRSVDKKFGTISLHFSSVWSDKNGNHIVPVNKDEIDVYCIYCPETDLCYWLNPKDFGQSVTLRVETSKNNQKAKVHLASDYTMVP